VYYDQAITNLCHHSCKSASGVGTTRISKYTDVVTIRIYIGESSVNLDYEDQSVKINLQ